jgi:hypothetical protein
VGYALSKAEEVVEAAWVPRPFDQRHALNLDLAFRPSPSWTLSVGWTYHSPWPSTEETFDLHQTVRGSGFVASHFGPMNQERLIPYRRLDFRISGNVPVPRGDLVVYLDVFNATNRLNAQSAEYGAWVWEGNLETERTFNYQFEMLPSLGLRWVF